MCQCVYCAKWHEEQELKKCKEKFRKECKHHWHIGEASNCLIEGVTRRHACGACYIDDSVVQCSRCGDKNRKGRCRPDTCCNCNVVRWLPSCN